MEKFPSEWKAGARLGPLSTRSVTKIGIAEGDRSVAVGDLDRGLVAVVRVVILG